MRSRHLLERARRIAAERKANAVDLAAVKARLLEGVMIEFVAPDGSTVERVSAAEFFARRDGTTPDDPSASA